MSNITQESPTSFFKRRIHSTLDMSGLIVPNKTPGVRSAGQPSAELLLGVGKVYGTAAAANGIIEVCTRQITSSINYQNGNPLNGVNNFDLPFYFAMTLNSGSIVGASTGERFMGIEWGSMGVLPPFQTNFNVSPNNGCIQLRYNYTLSRWEVLVWANDGNPPDIHACTVNPPFTPDLYIAEIAINYSPANIATFTGSRLQALHEGKVILELVDDPRVNILVGLTEDYLAGYFMTNGSGAASTAPDYIFMHPKVLQPISRLF